MNVIPLNFAVFGACISLDTEKPFDVKAAYTIARRRLRPEVKSHLTGILSSIVPPGKTHPTSWKFAFRDKKVESDASRRVVLVHGKYSSENKASRNDFRDSIGSTRPTGENQIVEIPALPLSRPSGACYQFELIADDNRQSSWIIHSARD